MQCRECGQPLGDDERVCSRCGASRETVRSPLAAPRVPVAAYAPSRQGPPVAAEIGGLPAALPVQLAPTDETAPLRRYGYHPVVLPAGPSRGNAPRRLRFGRSALALLALFAVLGLAAGLVARGGNVPIPLLAATRPQPTATPTTPPACNPAPLARLAPAPLGPPQLTTGLRDFVHQDYRPVNNVTRFTAGKQGYVTVQVLASRAGTVEVLVCTPGHRFTGHPVLVPKGSTGRYVEYPVSFGSADVGQGMVTISWDASVVGNEAFTVTP